MIIRGFYGFGITKTEEQMLRNRTRPAEYPSSSYDEGTYVVDAEMIDIPTIEQDYRPLPLHTDVNIIQPTLPESPQAVPVEMIEIPSPDGYEPERVVTDKFPVDPDAIASLLAVPVEMIEIPSPDGYEPERVVTDKSPVDPAAASLLDMILSNEPGPNMPAEVWGPWEMAVGAAQSGKIEAAKEYYKQYEYAKYAEMQARAQAQAEYDKMVDDSDSSAYEKAKAAEEDMVKKIAQESQQQSMTNGGGLPTGPEGPGYEDTSIPDMQKFDQQPPSDLFKKKQGVSTPLLIGAAALAFLMLRR